MSSSEYLFRFAEGGSVADQRAALVDLIRTKEIHVAADSGPFRRGLERLADSVRESDAEDERLLAVATLGRSATVPALSEPVGALLRDLGNRPLGDLHELPNAHDRRYAAKSLRHVPSAWVPDVLATAAAREGSGRNQKVRIECIEGLVDRADDEDGARPDLGIASGPHDVAGVISAVRKALEKLEFTTKKPGDSMGRRLTRMLIALNAVLVRAEKRVGENAGEEVKRLVVRPFRVVGRPESPDVREDVAEQVAALTHTIIRMDLPYGRRDSTYQALSLVSHWFTPHGWRDICESSPAVRRVRKDVRTSLVFLMEAGKTDDRLRDALALTAGSRETASAISRAIATERPGIPDDVRDWLVRAPKRIQIASATESRERAVDEVLAELLIVMRRLTWAAQMVRADVLPEVSIVLPQQARPVSRLAGLAEAMASKLRLAAEWRSLRLRGQAGQEVEFSPVEHQRDTSDARSRRVRLLGPVVERISQDGVPRVVLKAPVESITDPTEQDDRDFRVTATAEA